VALGLPCLQVVFCFFFSFGCREFLFALSFPSFRMLLASWLWLRGSLAYRWEFGFKSFPWLYVAFCDLSTSILSVVLN
jgi:hypothetical protein